MPGPRIGDASEDTLQEVLEELQETPETVTALPLASTPGTPVYVVDGKVTVIGEVTIAEPVDVKIKDLVGTDPEPTDLGLAVRVIADGVFANDVRSLARTVGPNDTAGSQSVALSTDQIAGVDPAADAVGAMVRLIADGLFYEKLKALADSIGSQPASKALTFRFPNDALPLVGKNTSSSAGGGQVVEVNTGPTQIFLIRATFEGAGQPYYLQIHNAATATAVSTATFTGFVYPCDQLNLRFQATFGGITPLTLPAGCKLAISSTEKTYTAADQQFYAAYMYRVPPS